jgi:hypothetical protein
MAEDAEALGFSLIQCAISSLLKVLFQKCAATVKQIIMLGVAEDGCQVGN